MTEYQKILKLYHKINHRYLKSLDLALKFTYDGRKARYHNKECFIALIGFYVENDHTTESLLMWLSNIDKNLQKSNICCEIVFNKHTELEEHKIAFLDKLTYE